MAPNANGDVQVETRACDLGEMLDLSVVAVVLPEIHESLHSSFADLQWVFDAYALTLAIFLVAAGSLADRHGGRRSSKWASRSSPSPHWPAASPVTPPP
ncbi:MFS transporter [Streptomyces sp. NPDC059455]|uniref:MFS transporter n=1 Tax=Streptomyces sp. NPDC059455 TaxID=3346837 RepID=UPI003673E077